MKINVIVSQLLAGSACIFPLIHNDSKTVANLSGIFLIILNFRKMPH